jgi:hypothetical protein
MSNNWKQLATNGFNAAKSDLHSMMFEDSPNEESNKDENGNRGKFHKVTVFVNTEARKGIYRHSFI